MHDKRERAARGCCVWAFIASARPAMPPLRAAQRQCSGVTADGCFAGASAKRSTIVRSCASASPWLRLSALADNAGLAVLSHCNHNQLTSDSCCCDVTALLSLSCRHLAPRSLQWPDSRCSLLSGCTAVGESRPFWNDSSGCSLLNTRRMH